MERNTIVATYDAVTGRLTLLTPNSFNFYDGDKAIELWQQLETMLNEKSWATKPNTSATQACPSEPCGQAY